MVEASKTAFCASFPRKEGGGHSWTVRSNLEDAQTLRDIVTLTGLWGVRKGPLFSFYVCFFPQCIPTPPRRCSGIGVAMKPSRSAGILQRPNYKYQDHVEVYLKYSIL